MRLARAFLLQTHAMLILDEATNSLDLENEAAILRAVRARGTALTTLLISHRPSAVAAADRVYVLKAGRCARVAFGVKPGALPKSGLPVRPERAKKVPNDIKRQSASP